MPSLTLEQPWLPGLTAEPRLTRSGPFAKNSIVAIVFSLLKWQSPFEPDRKTGENHIMGLKRIHSPCFAPAVSSVTPGPVQVLGLEGSRWMS